MSNPSINLFTSYYNELNEARRGELDKCLALNAGAFDTIYLFNESHRTTFPSPVRDIIVDKRPLYSTYFDCFQAQEINIIANSDIYFTKESLELISTIKEGECFALSRWDVDLLGNASHFDHRDSQDAWCFLGTVAPIAANFPQGRRGCDNRLAWEVQRAGYSLLNPSKSIKTYHLHNSGVRRYSKLGDQDLIRGPYLTILPTSL
jgi:hypothetical protein